MSDSNDGVNYSSSRRSNTTVNVKQPTAPKGKNDPMESDPPHVEYAEMPRRTSMASGRREVDTGGRTRRESTSFLNRTMSSIFDDEVGPHTRILQQGFEKILKSINERITGEKYSVGILTRGGSKAKFDCVLISRRYFYGSTPVTSVYVFIIAASRGELAAIPFDIPNYEKFTLPNVCGDTPDDRRSLINDIRLEIQNHSQKLFRSSEISIVATRVIESNASIPNIVTDGTVDETKLRPIRDLLYSAVETLETFDTIYNPENEHIDWTRVATGPNGYAVTNSIDYNPQPLFNEVDIPIHRSLKLTTSCFTDESEENGRFIETKTLTELSAFLDIRYSEPEEYENDPSFFPVLVITDVKTDLGKNLFELFWLGVANIIQLKDDYQYVPVYDWRKKDPRSDLSFLGYEAPISFDHESAELLSIVDNQSFLKVAEAAFQDAMEFAIDTGDTDRNSFMTDILADAVRIDSPGYLSIINTLNNLSDGAFGEVFFRDSEREVLIIDGDNLQIGGQYTENDTRGVAHKYDARAIGHLAVLQNSPHDMEKVEDYDDSVIGNDIPAAYRLHQQLTLKEEVVNRINVGTYFRRFTLSPALVNAIYESFSDNLLIAPLDGTRLGPRSRRRTETEMRARGVKSNSRVRGRTSGARRRR